MVRVMDTHRISFTFDRKLLTLPIIYDPQPNLLPKNIPSTNVLMVTRRKFFVAQHKWSVFLNRPKVFVNRWSDSTVVNGTFSLNIFQDPSTGHASDCQTGEFVDSQGTVACGPDASGLTRYAVCGTPRRKRKGVFTGY